MDKFVKFFAEQNPQFEIDCGNPKCRKKIKAKTIDVFSKKDYTVKCPYCGMSTTFEDAEKFIKETKKAFEKAGISWK